VQNGKPRNRGVPPPPGATVKANKPIVRRFLDELWNKHNLGILDELTLYPRNPAARPFLAAFPDIHATVELLTGQYHSNMSKIC
jgi:hypothetical protein